jgi:hypothetical protein
MVSIERFLRRRSVIFGSLRSVELMAEVDVVFDTDRFRVLCKKVVEEKDLTIIEHFKDEMREMLQRRKQDILARPTSIN